MSQPPCPKCRKPLERFPLYPTTCPHCGVPVKPGARGRVLVDRGSSGLSSLLMFVLLIGGAAGGVVWYLKSAPPGPPEIPAAPVANAPPPAAPAAPDAPVVAPRPKQPEPKPAETTAAPEEPAPVEKPEVVKDPEKEARQAAAKLKMARQLLDKGNKARGRQYLEELVKQYPDAPAADDARKMLEKLPEPGGS